MERITNIETTENITTAVFLTRDIAEVNLLRRAILSEIETYAIDIVKFQINTSPRHDEIIAFRLGQLVIDNSQFVPPEDGNFISHIDFQGPGKFTSNHIPDLSFKYVTPIAELRAGQRIKCDVIVKSGQSKQHAKWRPVSTVTLSEIESGLFSRPVKTETGPYVIDTVRFELNQSHYSDDTIALRFGQLIIKHPEFPDGTNVHHINFQGPGEFTTNDIPGYQFKYATHIVTLTDSEQIICDITVNRRKGQHFVKWQPVGFTGVDNGYRIVIKGIGMLPGPEIIEKGLAKMKDAAHRPPITLFSQPLVPINY